MDPYSEIARKIKSLAGTSDATLFTAEVKSVDGETCSVLVGDLELPDVMLTPADDGKGGKLVLSPKAGSMVTVADLSGGQMRRLAVVHWGQVQKITCSCDNIELNGGGNGGLVNIGKLKGWMRNVETDLNTLKTLLQTSPIVGNGAPAAIAFTPMTGSVESDIEDTKITH